MADTGKIVEHRVADFGALHDVLRRYHGNYAWMFRGHRDASWRLVPKAGRSAYFQKHEKAFFEAWKRRAVEYMSVVPASEWDWLAVAQHYGLATRMLDWSANPLVACFFAVEGDQNVDRVVYAFKPGWYWRLNKTSPFEVTSGIGEYRPSAFVARISRQGARFTLHSPPDADLADNLPKKANLEKITIDAAYVGTLRRELDQYGINWASIYPDLDGLSRHLCWVASDQESRRQLLKENEIEVKESEIEIKSQSPLTRPQLATPARPRKPRSNAKVASARRRSARPTNKRSARPKSKR